MALALTIILFLTVALGVFSFGAAAYAPSSVLGARLRALGWQKSQPREKPAFRERLEHALDPFSKALPLSPSEVSRTRKWLIQAGYREPRHLTMYVGKQHAAANVHREVARLAVARLNEPFTRARDFTWRERQSLAEGIERMLQPLPKCRLFTRLGLLPAQRTQAGPQHR